MAITDFGERLKMIDEYVLRLEALGFPVLKGGDSGGDGSTPPEGAPAGTAATPPAGTSPVVEEPEKDAVVEGIRARKEAGKATEVEVRLLALMDKDEATKTQMDALKEAAKEKDKLQDALDEIQRKEKSDLDNATSDLTKAQEKLQKLEGTLRKSLLENAIRGHDGFTWHDISDVVGALDPAAIKVDLEQGTIEGLAGELKRVASAKPHYVKSKKGERKPADQQTPQQPSGVQPYNVGSAHNDAATRKAKLRETYPILRNA